ncbi:hypothetical protein C8A05DRAFT_38902 [Staphylotrichum tortipilum]|uniref:NACHT domain-containing protein n=1 Tax=Staphylotrichum tortipilum TaxID=2831512 RepID=A0AAN6RNF0_9PEZI|nr:hypothetical protein C8A05DRAFT_38902 [Staphylotrichum longicolle]
MPSFLNKYRHRHRRQPTDPPSPLPPSTPATPEPTTLSPTPSNPSRASILTPSTPSTANPATLSPSNTLDLQYDNKAPHTHLTLPLRTPSPLPTLTPSPTPPGPQTPLNTPGLTLIHTPPSTSADIIFIHGLGGSSHGTWSWERKTENFWPRWLKADQKLGGCRVFTFGYNAGLVGAGAGGDGMAVLDFAMGLLGWVRGWEGEGGRVGEYPIVFVVHSMGGLVAKKAYIIGKADEHYRHIMAQARGMLFLGTPQRGSDLAGTLGGILSTLFVNKGQYIKELDSMALSLRDINQQFPSVCGGLQLASLYETKETPLATPLMKKMIVDNNSAVLGYPGEFRAPLDADHHGMSKFKGAEDPNYIQVRNVLCMLVEAAMAPPKECFPVVNPTAAETPTTPAPTRKQLSQVLGVHSHPKTDLDILQDRIMDGSCRWILDRDTFQQWRDGIADSGCALLWLKGLPGAGKSILSSFVIRTLHKDHPGVPCCYYFFNSRDQTKRSVKNMLTSIALQLGMQSRPFGELLLKWGEEGNGPVDQLQAVNVWASIFQDLAFCEGEETPMFWVIDGLDEADDPKTLVQLFKKLEATHRLRIWIASRHIKEMTAVRAFGAKVSLDEITLDDTSHDIRAYADRSVSSILPDGALDVKDDICKTILHKAQGSFLWVSLAIDQLENKWHTPEAIREALEDLPEGMEGFYDRMMTTIGSQTATRALACRILTWAICSFRPLNLAELEIALAHEFPRLVNLEGTIAQACASFVVVRNAHIALLHDTARAFLLDRDGAPPLSIDLRQGEAYLAEMCLRYLISRGNELLRILSSANAADQSGRGGVPPVFDEHPFLEYAVIWWAYHLGRALPTEDLAALAQEFLQIQTHFLPLSAVSSIVGMNSSDIRDMDAGQWAYWATALPVTAVVVVLGLVFTGEMRRLWEWIGTRGGGGEIRVRTRKKKRY